MTAVPAPRMAVGLAPDQPGMVALVLDGRVKMLTWVEAINLGGSLFTFGSGEGANAQASRELIESTVEDAINDAATAHARALEAIRQARQ